MSRESWLLSCVWAGCLGALGCSDGTAGEEAVGTITQDVVGQDEYLYFRCNATSWDVDTESRLLGTSDPYTFTLTYEVTEPWMVEGGDNCTVTVTDELDGWGTEQSFLGVREGFSPIVVPSSAPLSANTQSLQVKYPETGAYTVSVNWRSGSISIAPAQSLEEAAAENASRFYAYLQDRFGWAGIDGTGEEAPIVFSASPANNAQWTGASLIIGEADGIRTRSFAFSPDMIAHELVHAVNTHTANLRPASESGAVNESFADVLAVFSGAESGAVDWKIGESLWTPEIPGDALRRVDYPHSGFHRETLQACQFDANDPFICGQARHLSEYVNVPGAGGEHINQGILNRAAYLLVEGGSDQGVVVTGIGVAKAEQIYFRALTQLLPSWATLPDARYFLGVACEELTGQYGITSQDCASVEDAFDAVGVPNPVLDAAPGISGTVTDGGVPANVTVILAVNGKASPAIGNLEILETTTDANGHYHFTQEDIDAALAPPLPPIDVVCQVRYRNPDPSNLDHVAEWSSEWFDESTYAAGTHVPSFDVAGLAPMTTSGAPTSLPIEFLWTARTAEREYFRWTGRTDSSAGLRETPSNIHPTPALLVTAETVDDFTGSADFAALSEWSVGIRSYSGTGATHFVPIE